MDQGADHIFLVPAVAMGPGGGLQGMLQTVHREAAGVFPQHP